MIGGGRPLLREKFGEYGPTPLHNADFQSIFARSASAVTACKKVQLPRIGSPVRAALSSEPKTNSIR